MPLNIDQGLPDLSILKAPRLKFIVSHLGDEFVKFNVFTKCRDIVFDS